MNSLTWTGLAIAGWFVANWIGTAVNFAKDGNRRFIRVEQFGDVPMQSSRSPRRGEAAQTSTHLRTSGRLIVHRPQWLRAPVQAINNMRAQAPYVAAVMALAWWIERMWFAD